MATKLIPPAKATGMDSVLRIASGQFSSAGAKPDNQDFHGILVPEGADLVAKGIAICLADGISTSRLGAAAAETAVKSFLTDYYCTSPAWSARTSGERVIAATNSWMQAHNRRRLGPSLSDGEREQGMICTFSALVLKGCCAHVFHVGDCRIARLVGASTEELTEAHRVELGGGESYLGRALGVNRHVEIDYRRVAIEPGDLFVLTSDGVHEFIGDAEIAAIVARAHTLDEAAKALCRAARANGSEDNLTAQLVQVESLPLCGVDDLVAGEGALPAAPILAEGEAFDGYRIMEVLHAGSRSHVYMAQDDATGEVVAIKALSTELAQDPGALGALLLEDWVMRRLDHPVLLKAGLPDRSRTFAYSVSEYVAGESLHAWRLANSPPELALLRDFVKQLASGLQALHRREMVHRDLRPQNVLVENGRALKIVDFGSVQVAGLEDIAEPALAGAHAGTMQYSAPELYLGYQATPQSDLYSLGVIAYQLLTGELPYGPQVANARSRAAQRKLAYTPVTEHNPDVPDWMDAAIRKAVSIDPADRYDEISEFVFDLFKPNRELADPRPLPLFHRRSARFWQLVSAVLAAALLISLLTRPVAGQDHPSRPEPEAKP